MTGGQDHPGTGRRLTGEMGSAADPAEVCRALGVKDVKVLDSYDRKRLEEAIRDSLSRDEYSVIVCRRPCVLVDRQAKRGRYAVDPARCKNCGACLRLGCPAMSQAEGHVEISAMCAGCGLCVEACRFDAIHKVQ